MIIIGPDFGAMSLFLALKNVIRMIPNLENSAQTRKFEADLHRLYFQKTRSVIIGIS